MFKGDWKYNGAEAASSAEQLAPLYTSSPGAGDSPGPITSRWLWKKGSGKFKLHRFQLGGRPWAKRFVVIVCSRDGVEPSAVLYFHAAPARIDGEPTWEHLASLTADEDAGVVLLDSAACKVRAITLGGDDGADRHGRFRFLITHPKRGARVFACSTRAEREVWVSGIRVAIERGNEVVGQGAKRRQLSIDEQQKRTQLVKRLETLLLDEPDDADADALADGADDDDELAEASESGTDARSTGATDDWSSVPSEGMPCVEESDEDESDADEDLQQAERRLTSKQAAVAGIHGALNDYARALQTLVSARSALADAAILHENAFAADDAAPSSDTPARRLAHSTRALREEALPATLSVVRARVVKEVQSEVTTFEGIHRLLREKQKTERALTQAKEKVSSSESQKKLVKLLAKEQELTAAEAEIKHALAGLDGRRRTRLGDELAVLAACDQHVFGRLHATAAEELHLTGGAAAGAACELAVRSQRSRLASKGVEHRDTDADNSAPVARVSREAVLRALGEDSARRAAVARLIADTLGAPPPPPLERAGELEKRARSNFSRALWQPRFFTLDAGRLAYFASATDAEGAHDVAEDHCFDLAHCSVLADSQADPDLWKARASDLEFCVKPTSPAGGGGERELQLRARSAAERDAWLAALAAHSQYASRAERRRASDGDEDRERVLAALARGESDLTEPALRGLVDAFLEAVDDDSACVDSAALACVMLDGSAVPVDTASAPMNLADDEIDQLSVRELRELVRRARMPCTGIIDKAELRRLAKHAAAHVRVRALSVRELRELIQRAELSDVDCVERAELQKRALQADMQLRGEDPNAIAEMLGVLDAAAVARAGVRESAREAATTSPRQAAARRAVHEDDPDDDEQGHPVLLARNDSGRVHFSTEARASDGSVLPLDPELDADSRERVSSTLTFDDIFKEGGNGEFFEPTFKKGGASDI